VNPADADDRAVLVINCGSSSIKYQLLRPGTGELLASGVAERIGEGESTLTHRVGTEHHDQRQPLDDHEAAMRGVAEAFAEHGPELDRAGVVAVGHRVVHGGSRFDQPVVIDSRVEAAIEDLQQLAPLHNPPALAGIRAARRLLPDVPHVAVFDTAYFARLPESAARYAIPRDLADRHEIRRYGAHGTSHQYLAERVPKLLGRDPASVNQVTLHLGNGCSAAAIRGGEPIDTSMGLTPLQGLVMGARSGDVDPSLHAYLGRVAGLDLDQIDTMLNSESGLRGLAGVNDMRELMRLRTDGDEHASEAWDVYVHRIRHYLGGYAFALGRVDAVTFTGGVGEHAPELRAAVLAGLEAFGIEVDPAANQAASSDARTISTETSAVAIMVVPAAEELTIARQSLALVDRG